MATSPSDDDILTDEYDFSLGYHPSVPPLDVRVGLTPGGPRTSDPSPPLRWGILSTGKAAHDFTQALKRLAPHHEISAAAASSSPDKARAFADLHGIPRSHGTYAELCSDPTVDVVYVASLHPRHRECAELALRGGKHVLVEKPMCMTAADAEAVYALGEERDLFVGEGMWTRFFPAVEWTRMELEGGECEDDDGEGGGGEEGGGGGIGECRVVQADFSIDGDDVGPYPTDSLYKSDLGGGTLWTMGCYVVSAAMLPFGGREPDDVVARGVLTPDDDVGELAAGATLVFRSPNTSDGTPATAGSIASILVGYLSESSETTQYAAKRGRITVGSPAHCPTSATRVLRPRGGGRAGEDGVGHLVTTVRFPLPPSVDSVERSGGFKMPNSMGFAYEAEAVRRLIRAGRRTFPQWTPEESVGCLRTIERIREQVHGP